ncbi:hypothetical protein AB205_0210380, partial [Aquarana catesbeiana]
MVFIKQVTSKRKYKQCKTNTTNPLQTTIYTSKRRYRNRKQSQVKVIHREVSRWARTGNQQDGERMDGIGSEQSRTETGSQSGYRQQGQGAGRKIPRQAYEGLPGIYRTIIDFKSHLSAEGAVCSTLLECTRWWTPVLRPKDATVPPAGETSYCRSQVLEDTRWWTLVLQSKRPIATPTGKPSHDSESL